MSAQPALVLEDVRAGYGTAMALHGVSLVVPAGKAVALLGANGAGKTTTLKVAAGFIRPTSGRILLSGRSAEGLSVHRRSRQGLCLITEGRGIFRSLSVKDNLAVFCRGRQLERAVDVAASIFPILGTRLGQEAGMLSGGQQQMLALARVLVAEPNLIMADELSLGLAPLVVDEIFEALGRLKADGRSLLIVEQYVGRALDLVDYVYVMHKGRVVFVGEPKQCADERVFEQYLGEVG
jgi:branched-chain amino acid transport system ATP-binding protein